jgi:hypothetical protein
MEWRLGCQEVKTPSRGKRRRNSLLGNDDRSLFDVATFRGSTTIGEATDVVDQQTAIRLKPETRVSDPPASEWRLVAGFRRNLVERAKNFDSKTIERIQLQRGDPERLRVAKMSKASATAGMSMDCRNSNPDHTGRFEAKAWRVTQSLAVTTRNAQGFATTVESSGLTRGRILTL